MHQLLFAEVIIPDGPALTETEARGAYWALAGRKLIVDGLKMLGKSNGLKPTLIFGLLLLCFLAAPETQAWKKNIRFERLTPEDGLSHVLVDSIAQDHQAGTTHVEQTGYLL